MLNGEIRSKIDALWNAFWTGGISNPLEVIEQITYLLFLKRLDDLHTLEENKASRLKFKKLERRVFPEGKDPKGRPYEDCRWSRFKHFEAKEMFELVDQHVFPFLRMLGGDDSTYAQRLAQCIAGPVTQIAGGFPPLCAIARRVGQRLVRSGSCPPATHDTCNRARGDGRGRLQIGRAH